MPTPLTSLKIFIASPGGLTEERKAFRDAVLELNDADALARGVLFLPVGWEETLGGIGRPLQPSRPRESGSPLLSPLSLRSPSSLRL